MRSTGQRNRRVLVTKRPLKDRGYRSNETKKGAMTLHHCPLLYGAEGGAQLTISDSEVTLGAVEDDVTSLFETQLLDALNATSASITVTNNKRRLVGHSEWVANLQVGYDSDNGEHSATLVYNAFGPRIIVPGTRGNEDAEEQTYHSLDMNYTYYPDFNTRIKFSIKNLPMPKRR